MAQSGHVYTVLLGAIAAGAPGEVRLFGNELGDPVVIRDLVLSQNDGEARKWLVYWVYQAVAYHLINRSLTGGNSFHEDLRQAVPAGAVVYVNSEATTWTVLCTGYRFATPATGGTPLPTRPELWGNSPQE